MSKKQKAESGTPRHAPIKHVGLMVETLHGYGARILDGVARFVRANPGWRIAYFDGERAEMIDHVRHWQGDGIICTIADEGYLDAAKSRKIPVVNVTARHLLDGMASVLGDDSACGRMAAAYFLDRGFTSFGFAGSLGSPFGHDRGQGFIDALAEKGIEVSVLDRGVGEDTGTEEWVRHLPAATAVYCSTDRRGAAVIEATWQVGRRVPEEIAVLGTGDHSQLCDLTTPSLSSIDSDLEQRGFEAASLLARMMSGDTKPGRPILVPPVGVITRRSTDVYAFEDQALARALHFIHQNADKSIKVANVVAAAGVSRRSLETKFSRFCQHSLHDEIWRAHFDLAKRLLATTDLGLQQVAERSGFRTASALANLFRQRTGLTPRSYRAAHRRAM